MGIFTDFFNGMNGTGEPFVGPPKPKLEPPRNYNMPHAPGTRGYHLEKAGQYAGSTELGRINIRENLANSVGIASSRQRAAGGFTGTAGRMVMRTTTAGVFAAGAVDGSSPLESSGEMIGGAAALTGFGVGRELGLAKMSGVASSGFTANKYAGLDSWGKIQRGIGAISRFTIKQVGGLAAGLAGGLAYGGAAYGLVEGFRQSMDSNNIVKQVAEKYTHSDFINKDLMQNQSTTTGRQRALSQLSKSALNNRGQLLGNEAAIIAGMM